MNLGKTIFTQIMEFVPWTSVNRIVDRYASNAGIRRLSCAEQFRATAFAQLTSRESLRDLVTTLTAHPNKRYGLGLRHAVRSPLWPMPTEPSTGVSGPMWQPC